MLNHDKAQWRLKQHELPKTWSGLHESATECF